MAHHLTVVRQGRRLDSDVFSRRSGLHPDLVRRFVALGLIRATRGSDGRLWFEPSQLAAAARVERLRSGLSLNYAALGLVIELLDRIHLLEDTLRRQRHVVPGQTTVTGSTQWTSTD